MFQSLKRFLASLAIAGIVISPYSPLLSIAHAAVTVTPATGGTAIPASSAGTTNWTTVTGPVITEANAGEIGDNGTGLIQLNAPAGFEFDTTGIAPTVVVTRVSSLPLLTKSFCNINDVVSGTSLPVTVTASRIDFTVAAESSDAFNINPLITCFGNRNSLTWQNIRVRPISVSPLVSGNISKTGSSNISGVNGSTNFGTLAMVASDPSLTNSLVSVTPTSTVVGTSATLTIALKDASNNPVVGFSAGNVSISMSGTGNTVTPFPTSTVSNASGTVATTLTSTVAETKTVTVTILGINGGTLVNTATVTFVPGAPAKADIAASTTSTVVGNPINLTISVKDQYDNVVADGSSATLTSTLGTISGSSTTVAGVFSRTINSTTTGSATLGFSDLAAPMTVTGVTSIQFLPDVPASVVITTQPSSTLSVDFPFSTQPALTVQDQYGNNVADGTIVTASVETGTGMLRNISTITTAGIATYGTVSTTELGYSKSDEVFSIRFSAGAANAVSQDIGPLMHGAIVKVVPVANPTNLIEGAVSTITVYGQDQFGNTTTNNNSATGLISVDNGASISPTTVFLLNNGIFGAEVTKNGVGVVKVTTLATIPSGLFPGTTQVTFTKSDVTAPTFVSSIPTQSATGVSITSPLLLTFSEALKASTVTSANAYLVNASTSATVSATVSLVEGGKIIQITPSSPLEYATSYYFEATGGITDEADNALAIDAVSSSTTGFTTEENLADVTGPTVVSQYPTGSDVSVSVVPFVNFSENMKASTLTPASVGIKKVSDDSVIPATITVANGGTRAVITPDAPLENSTSYYVFVATDATDEAGNPLQSAYGNSELSVFTTAAVIVPADETAPIITSIQALDITTSSVRIVWNTNEPADSQVEFGLTSGYGSMTDLDTATTTEHSVIITGLLSNQTYHFRVLSADENENQAVSDDNTFATAFDDSAVLGVTQISLVKSFAIANDMFEDGWRWIFDVTAPTNEQNITMKFSDFLGVNSAVIPAANNIRIYSAESSNAQNASSSIAIVAADTYSDELQMTTDRNSGLAGRQVQIIVEAKVPVGTPGGSYSASYGIQSLAEEIQEYIGPL